jgi:hypothetical protein
MTSSIKELAERTIALELSVMRSGSTLLKALMAAAPDISSLPETNFQKFQSATAASEIASLCDERIVVLKRPAWFNETKRYPKLPNVPNAKRVILARDVHTTTASLRKMVFRKAESWAPRSIDNWFANKYWAPVYANLLDRFPDDGTSNFWIRYEDLVQEPIEWTGKLFRFLGSDRAEGTDSYPPPQGYDWKWGSDDGGDKIKSLTVQAPKIPQSSLDILERVQGLPQVALVRARLGYANS